MRLGGYISLICTTTVHIKYKQVVQKSQKCQMVMKLTDIQQNCSWQSRWTDSSRWKLTDKLNSSNTTKN